MVAVCLSYAFHDDRIAAAAGRRREFQAQCRGVFLVHFYQFQLFQHLHTALHLERLAVRTLEAFDEVLGFLNHLLLFLVLFHLLFAAFFPEYQVLRVVHLVVVDASHGHLDGAGGDVVYKFPVVADDYHCLGTVDEEILQPLDGFDVQVVGRLVQQQDVRVLEQ